MVAFAKDPKGENIFKRGGTFTHSVDGTTDKKRRPTMLSIGTPMSPVTPNGTKDSFKTSSSFKTSNGKSETQKSVTIKETDQ